ncbi:MAG: response regulator [Paracoccaceae bacterium]
MTRRLYPPCWTRHGGCLTLADTLTRKTELIVAFDMLSPSPDRLRGELLRQRDILRRETRARVISTVLALTISFLFLPVGVVLALIFIYLAMEVCIHHTYRNIDALLARGGRYWALLGFVCVQEACFLMLPGLVWFIEEPFARAYAAGMAACAMMHIATVRAIHLPMGISGLAGIATVLLGANTLYWVTIGGFAPWAVITFCSLIALCYCLSAMLSNHQVHRETLAGWTEAKAANAAKTRFLSQVSHELRTPLNAILGMGYAELSRSDDPAARGRMELLIEAATGLGVLLDDTLDMAAVEEGRLPIRPVALDLPKTISAAVALFRPQAEAAGLALDLGLDEGLPGIVQLDGQRLRQCLSNILSNALKHTEQGGVRIVAGVRDGLLQIEVQDSGRGVPEAFRATIFEPFQRAPGSHGGTGLGLTISRTLARRMGGDLVLVPSETGACFVLTLALVPGSPGDLSPAGEPEALDLSGKLFLIVDDIATNRLVAATYLRGFGARVSEADSGETALAMVQVAPPSAILLDMNMPGLSGLETLQRLRALGALLEGVPVIAMTADATETHRLQYLAGGVDGYLAKPLTPERLAEALRPHLGRRVVARSFG